MERPLIGIAVVIVKKGKILLGKDTRKGGVYGIPGGHMEGGETLKEGAFREVTEDTGLVCDNLRLVSVHDFFREDKQRTYVTICFAADRVSGEPKDAHEEGRVEWQWYRPEDVQKLNFYPAARLQIEHYLSGRVFE